MESLDTSKSLGRGGHAAHGASGARTHPRIHGLIHHTFNELVLVEAGILHAHSAHAGHHVRHGILARVVHLLSLHHLHHILHPQRKIMIKRKFHFINKLKIGMKQVQT